MISLLLAAIILIQLIGPGRQRIKVNPDAISSMREAQPHNKEYLREGTKCVLRMTNGKLSA
jgi:hypothetical protein